MVDLWINHVESRLKRHEITHNTKVNKINTIKNGVLPYLIDQKVLRVAAVDGRKTFKNYVEWRTQQGVKRSTLVTEIKHIKEFVTWLHLKNLLPSPVVDLSLPRQTYQAKAAEGKVEAFTDEEIDLITNELNKRINETTGDEKYRWTQIFLFVQFMLDSGMRTDEVRNLTFGQVSLRGLKGKVQKECSVDIVISKTGPRQAVFMSSSIYWLMELYQSKGIKIEPNTPLWINPETGKKFWNGFHQHWFRRLLNDLGFDHQYRLYSLRHSHITQAIERGVDVYLISKLVGNSVGMITQTYDQVIMSQNTKQIFKDERGDEEDRFQRVVG